MGNDHWWCLKIKVYSKKKGVKGVIFLICLRLHIIQTTGSGETAWTLITFIDDICYNISQTVVDH